MDTENRAWCLRIATDQIASSRPLSRNSSTKLWKWNELHVESCGLLSCPTELVLSVFSFVIFDSLVHILLTELEHAINKSRQGVRHRCDRFGCPEPGSQTTKLCAQCASAPYQAPGSQAQSGGRPIHYAPGPALEHLASTGTIVRAQAEPRSEVLLCFPSAHVQSHLRYHRLGNPDVDAVDLSQVHPGDTVQMPAQIKVRLARA